MTDPQRQKTLDSESDKRPQSDTESSDEVGGTFLPRAGAAAPPEHPSARGYHEHNLLRLQRNLGNRATTHKIQRRLRSLDRNASDQTRPPLVPDPQPTDQHTLENDSLRDLPQTTAEQPFQPHDSERASTLGNEQISKPRTSSDHLHGSLDTPALQRKASPDAPAQNGDQQHTTPAQQQPPASQEMASPTSPGQQASSTGTQAKPAPIVPAAATTAAPPAPMPSLPAQAGTSAGAGGAAATPETSAPIAGGDTKVTSGAGATPVNATSSAINAQPAADAGASSPQFQGFLQQVQTIQESVAQTTTDRKKTITEGANAEKQNITSLVEGEAVRLENIYDNTINNAHSAITNARTEIDANKTAKIESTRSAAQAELDRLDTVERDKKEAMRRVADQKADSATTMGEREAQRAIDGSQTHVGRAEQIKQAKIAELKNVKDGARLASDVEQRVGDIVREFTKAGGELAAMARKRAGEAAEHITTEATELIAKMGQPATDARTTIIKCRDETIKSIQNQAQTSLSNIQNEADTIIAKLQSERQVKCAQVRANAESMSQAVDESVKRAHVKVDNETTRINKEITRFVNKITEVKWAGPQIESAGTDLTKAVSEHNDEQDGFATDVVTSVKTGITSAITNLGEAVTAQGNAVTTIGTDFGAAAAKISAKVVEKMEDARKEGAEGFAEPAKQVEEKLQRGVDRAGEEWERQIKVVENDISHDINDGLRKQDDAIAALESSLDGIGSKARSFVSSIVEAVVNFGSFIAGVVVGMLEHIWDILKDLWELIKKPLFWIVVAILAVALIIALAFFTGAEIVAALGFILKVLLVVGIVIGVLFAIYYIYLAFTKPDLSPYERGKLVGKAIDEIILAFIGTGVWAKLGGWVARVGRIAAFLDKVGDIVKAVRLLNRVREIEVAIRLIDEIKDAGIVLRLLDEINDVEAILKLWRAVGNAEDILKLWAKLKNADNIIKLWTEIKNADTILKLWAEIKDVDNIIKLWKEINNVDTILKLWAEIKDADKIIKLWVGIKDADAILKLWAKIKDADLIMKLWGKLADADKLVELLDKVKDGELLFRLLDKVPDIGQLERLLSKVDKAADLDKLLQHMTPKEIEDFINALGDMNLFKQLASKYGGDALKFYGAQFFKDFKGITSHTKNHLLVGDGIKGSKLSGCHDKAAFDALVASGQISIDPKLTRASGKFIEYTYQVVGKAKQGVKTVVDGLAADWPAWEAKIAAAIDDLIKNKTFPMADNAPIPPTPVDGANWTGWFSSGGTKEISTFYPTL